MVYDDEGGGGGDEVGGAMRVNESVQADHPCNEAMRRDHTTTPYNIVPGNNSSLTFNLIPTISTFKNIDILPLHSIRGIILQ
ncbi:hypothetical protein LIER_06508 [Lithospermum erythrorhizon]|uniref:Uncharacterized protein n=1 Tax=Lithospermum erythrorhizon TaxID=34254 RepID=A0AAV3P4T2_LITER